MSSYAAGWSRVPCAFVAVTKLRCALFVEPGQVVFIDCIQRVPPLTACFDHSGERVQS
ncbi:MAG: hypothetical protein ABSD85_06520 [Acidimicrobiales bacterium]